MKFTEEKLEQVFTELLEKQGFPYFPGAAIKRAPDEVIIEEDLKAFLTAKYEKESITENEIEQIILKLKSYAASDLYESNKAIMRLISEGFILKREDHRQKDLYIQLIDYAGLTALKIPDSEQLQHIAAEEQSEYTQDRNIYKFVNQFEIIGFEKRIPDGILFINGLPLVIFEFKTAIREDATIHNAWVQLTTRYKRDIPELFKYNAFCVISDGVNNKAGSFFAPYEFYYAWRKIEGMVKEVDGIDSMHSMIRGIFDKVRLRDIRRRILRSINKVQRKEQGFPQLHPRHLAE
mgnify:FL=1